MVCIYNGLSVQNLEWLKWLEHPNMIVMCCGFKLYTCMFLYFSEDRRETGDGLPIPKGWSVGAMFVGAKCPVEKSQDHDLY